MTPNCQNCQRSRRQHKSKTSRNKHPANNQSSSHDHNQTKQKPIRYFGCGLCKKDHRLATCTKYLDMNLTKKYDTIARLHYCKNCLARNHLLEQCQSKARCHICDGKHHSTLHGHKRMLDNSQLSSKHRESTMSTKSSTLATNTRPSHVSCNILRTVIPTAVIKIQQEEGTKFARALLNSSARNTSISQEFVREFELRTFRMEDNTYTKLTFKSTVPPYPRFEVNALVTNALPKNAYVESLPDSILSNFPRMELADPHFVSNNPIIVEIGADLHPAILKPHQMKAEGGLLMAMDSALGWFVIGSAIA